MGLVNPEHFLSRYLFIERVTCTVKLKKQWAESNFPRKDGSNGEA